MAFLTTGNAAADEPPASVRYAVASPGMLLAQDIARRHWGTDACNGRVEIVWGSEDVSVNARSYWANPRSAYDDPQLNVDCRIVFNGAIDFTWPKFCSVMVHEYGHLVGKPHVADGADVMSPIYRAPLAVCQGTPDPAAAAAEPEVAPVAVSDTQLDAALPQSRLHRGKAHTARAKLKAKSKSKSKAKARAAAAPRLHNFSSAGHDH